MKKIILDTDIGDDIDDAVALLLAVRSPELDIQGITTVYKNTKLRSAIVKKILDLEGKGNIPVYYGTASPIIEKVDEHEIPCQFTEEAQFGCPGAVRFIVDTLKKSTEKITLVMLGPMTNIALALSIDPEIKNNIEEIVMMAGSYYMHCNECNIASDPEAARIVFQSGVSIRAAGLDVTKMALLNEEQSQKFFSCKRAANRYVIHLLERWKKIMHHDRVSDPSLHDAVAVMAVIDDSFLKYRSEDVFVELSGEYTRGSTFLKNYAWGPRMTDHIKVAYEIDSMKFTEFLMQRLI